MILMNLFRHWSVKTCSLYGEFCFLDKVWTFGRHLFEGTGPTISLDKSDAMFVDVIHANTMPIIGQSD